MIGEGDTRLHELFEQASLLPAHERDEFLDQACRGDDELRSRIEKLLAWDTAAGTFLERGLIRRPELSERAGDTIGAYTLIRQIGEGGMAVVWLARQSEPVSRNVALKIVKPGMDTRSILARFELERQLLAHLNHPHVASVLDAGMSERGRPYFVMEYVDGQVFTKFCDTHQLAPVVRRCDVLVALALPARDVPHTGAGGAPHESCIACDPEVRRPRRTGITCARCPPHGGVWGSA